MKENSKNKKRKVFPFSITDFKISIPSKVTNQAKIHKHHGFHLLLQKLKIRAKVTFLPRHVQNHKLHAFLLFFKIQVKEKGAIFFPKSCNFQSHKLHRLDLFLLGIQTE